MLKLFQKWGKGKIKENNKRGEFKYNILQELSKMPQCTSA
jgi:hypothetical protein